MKAKKPDRFERMVEHVLTDSTALMISRKHAIQLLRREHRAVVRMVTALPLYIDKTGNAPGHYVSVNELLDTLKKRAQ